MFYRRSVQLFDADSRVESAKVSDNALIMIATVVHRLALAFVIIRLCAAMMKPLRRTAHLAIEDMRTEDFLRHHYSMVVVGWRWWGTLEAVILAAILTYVGRKTRSAGSSVILFVACAIWGWYWMAAFTFR